MITTYIQVAVTLADVRVKTFFLRTMDSGDPFSWKEKGMFETAYKKTGWTR